MLYGSLPFSATVSSSSSTSCDSLHKFSAIANHSKVLTFPADGAVSPEAIDLIRKLLTDADLRLGTIQAACRVPLP